MYLRYQAQIMDLFHFRSESFKFHELEIWSYSYVQDEVTKLVEDRDSLKTISTHYTSSYVGTWKRAKIQICVFLISFLFVSSLF